MNCYQIEIGYGLEDPNANCVNVRGVKETDKKDIQIRLRKHKIDWAG